MKYWFIKFINLIALFSLGVNILPNLLSGVEWNIDIMLLFSLRSTSNRGLSCCCWKSLRDAVSAIWNSSITPFHEVQRRMVLAKNFIHSERLLIIDLRNLLVRDDSLKISEIFGDMHAIHMNVLIWCDYFRIWPRFNLPTVLSVCLPS